MISLKALPAVWPSPLKRQLDMENVMSRFDEEPDGDPHGECAREINILRGLLLWALYHHQGASSAVGQPIRQALGIGQYEHMTEEQIAMAKEAAAFGMGHNAENGTGCPCWEAVADGSIDPMFGEN